MKVADSNDTEPDQDIDRKRGKFNQRFTAAAPATA
jgi:hypothetical protein